MPSPPACSAVGALPIYAKMQTAQLKAAAPACAVARPSMAQRSAFKAAPAPSVARPSFARRVQKLQKAASVQARNVVVVRAADDKVVVIGLAADSGCGKSTFMRRVTGIFGGEPKPPAGGNPDSNTLISDMTTVICLDDYHSLDRNVRRGPCCWGGGRHIWQLGGICSCAALRCAWQGCRAAVKLPRSMRAVTAGRLHLPGRPPPVAPRSPSCA